MRLCCTALILMALGAFTAPSAAQERPTSLSLFGSYTTSSKVFYRTADPDEFLRSQFFPLEDILSAGIDLRRTLPPGNLQLGLSAELISRSTESAVPYGTLSVPVTDGLTAVPVEGTGYFFIPVGNEEIRVFMGGGVGLYFGERRYTYAGTSAEVADRTTGFGIHVLSGMEWYCSPVLSVRGQLKFRDVQFETVNRFARSSATYQGTAVPLPAEPLRSRVNIDGMHLAVGLAVHF